MSHVHSLPLSRIVRLAVLAGCIGLPVAAAHAQAFDAVRLYGAAPGQDGGFVGVAVVNGTRYAGADERRTRALPALDYQWANGWFAGTGNGVGYNFSRRPDLQYGLRLTADLGRDDSDSRALRGMGDIDAQPEIGGFFNVMVTPEIFVTSALRYGAGNDGKGAVLDLGVGYSTEVAPGWRVGAGVGLSVVNAELMQDYFGVTAAQSARSGYAAYTAGAGVRDARANLALTYQLSPRMSTTAALSLNTLLGDAADSPLTRDRRSVSGVVALAYAF